MNDAELLRCYAEDHAEACFAEFVRRQVDLVHSAAVRQVGGDAHRANDVAQIVFTEAARNARSLARHPAVVGWLYTTTHFIAAKMMRAEQRRRAREEIHAMQESQFARPAETDWERLRPVLDELMHALNERERQAMLLRFFKKSSLAEVGAGLGISENAAQKTVERTLEKLRGLLVRRGITSTSAALAAVLEGQAVIAAPANLAATIAGNAVLAAGATAGTAGILGFMSTIKTAVTGAGLAGLTGLLTLSLGGVAVFEVKAARVAETDLEAARVVARSGEAALRWREESARATNQRVAELKAKTGTVRAALATAGAGRAREAAPARDPRVDGKAFLDAIGDGGRAQLIAAVRLQVRQSYALNFREADLSEAKMAELETLLVQPRFLMNHLLATPSSITPDPAYEELDEPEVRALFSEDEFRRLKEAVRKDVANDWVTGLALQVTGGGAPPVSMDQMLALTAIVARHSAEFQSGGEIDDATVDWGAVQTEARGVLSEAQWRQTEPWWLRREVERELAALKAGKGPR